METLAVFQFLKSGPVQVKDDHGRSEQEHIKIVGGPKEFREVIHELGIEGDKEKEKKRPKNRGHFKSGHDQVRKFLGQINITLLLSHDANDMADPGKNRHS